MTRVLLLDAGTGGWLRLAPGVVVDRGDDWATIPPADEPDRVVLALPAEQVAIHRLELPDLTPAQARAAARLAAADVVAAPLDTLHVAVGSRGADGWSMIAIVDAALLAAGIARAQALGLDPDTVMPDSLLLLPPDKGERHWRRGDRVVARGAGSAYAADADLAALLAGPDVDPVDDAQVVEGLFAAVQDPPVNLRQGGFARVRRWTLDWPLVRRLARLAALLLLATLAIQLVLIWRYARAADRAETDALAVARTAIPSASDGVDPATQLGARLNALRGGGLGWTATTGLLLAAVRDTGGVELTGVAFSEDGRLTATLAAAGTAELAAVRTRLAAAGLAVAESNARAEGARQLVDLEVRSR